MIKPDRVATLEKEISSQSTFELAAPLNGYVLSFPASSGEPIWASAVKGSLQDATNFSAFGQSPSAMMVVRQDGNTNARMMELSQVHFPSFSNYQDSCFS